MNLEEAVERACKEGTLIEALAWIVVWENERVVRQVRDFDRTGVSKASPDRLWDTCFTLCFKAVEKKFAERSV